MIWTFFHIDLNVFLFLCLSESYGGSTRTPKYSYYSFSVILIVWKESGKYLLFVNSLNTAKESKHIKKCPKCSVRIFVKLCLISFFHLYFSPVIYFVWMEYLFCKCVEVLLTLYIFCTILHFRYIDLNIYHYFCPLKWRKDCFCCFSGFWTLFVLIMFNTLPVCFSLVCSASQSQSSKGL